MRPEPRAVGAAIGRSGRRGRLGSSRVHSIHARTIDRACRAGISNRFSLARHREIGRRSLSETGLRVTWKAGSAYHLSFLLTL